MNPTLLLAQLTLAGLGLLGVAAAEPALVPDHALKCLAALLVTALVARVRPAAFIRLGPYLWGLAALALAATLVVGHGPNGVRRWLGAGPLEFQPSEFAKLALICYLASFFTRRGTGYKLAGPVAVIGLTAFLVLVAPSASAGGFTFVLALAVMFASGVGLFRIFSIVFIALSGALAASGLYLGRFGYVAERFGGFLSLREGNADALGEGYQNLRALAVLERAGLWGQGPDAPMPHLPAAHTDFVVVSVAHATGLLGVTMVLVAYWLVLSYGLRAAEVVTAGEARDRRWALGHGAAVLAAGGTIMVVGQAVVNLSVAIGALPNTGMTLPMMSYGGSNLVAAAVAFGWIHAALREAARAPGRPRVEDGLRVPA